MRNLALFLYATFSYSFNHNICKIYYFRNFQPISTIRIKSVKQSVDLRSVLFVSGSHPVRTFTSPGSLGQRFLSSHLLSVVNSLFSRQRLLVGFKAILKVDQQRTRLNSRRNMGNIHIFFLIYFYSQLVEFSLWIIL